jgi:hypothetical protein
MKINASNISAYLIYAAHTGRDITAEVGVLVRGGKTLGACICIYI